MPRSRALAIALLAVFASCESSVSEVDLEGDAALTGTFGGAFASVSDSTTLDGYLTLALQESASGDLTGGFTLEGDVDYGTYEEVIAGTGYLTGSVSPNRIALLYFTAIPDFCPAHPVEFTGTFDRRAGSLLVGGPITILDVECAVVLTFPSTISLHR